MVSYILWYHAWYAWLAVLLRHPSEEVTDYDDILDQIYQLVIMVSYTVWYHAWYAWLAVLLRPPYEEVTHHELVLGCFLGGVGRSSDILGNQSNQMYNLVIMVSYIL